MDHTLYPVLASHVGVGNYPVHAINGSHVWETSPVYMDGGCDEHPSLEISWKYADCRERECLPPWLCPSCGGKEWAS